MKFGAIDIGTNAARLLIGEVITNKNVAFVKKISYTRIPLRLGLEVFDNGIISEQKAIEFKKTMLAFKLIAEVFDVKDTRVCATSAMREAINGRVIQKMIQHETGVEIEIIDGDEEANIIFSSFLLIDYDLSRPFIVIDVGGGSTEISIFYKGEIKKSHSFNIGTVRLLKKKVDPNIWDDIYDWLAKNIKPDKQYLTFGTGGNINKIHKVLGKKGKESIPIKELRALNAELRKLTLEERILEFQLRPDRADVIIPASDIFIKIAKKLKCKELFVPKIGLSDGMIHLLNNKHAQKQSDK